MECLNLLAGDLAQALESEYVVDAHPVQLFITFPTTLAGFDAGQVVIRKELGVGDDRLLGLERAAWISAEGNFSLEGFGFFTRIGQG